MQRRGSLRVLNNGKTFIYDSSNFYGSAERWTVQRDSDNAIDTFSYSEISDGSYTTWLGGANGIIKSQLSERQKKTVVNEGTPYLLTDGTVSIRGSHKLEASFNSELTDFTMTMVLSNSANISNQRYNFGVWGANTGAMIYQFYDDSSAYRRRQIHFVVQTEGNVIQRKYFTATNYDNTIDNVIVMEVKNNVPTFKVNGTTYNTFSDTDFNFGWSEVGINKIILGNRSNPTTVSADYKHFGLYLEPKKTLQEISDELMAIY
jgi:hypothetical protein